MELREKKILVTGAAGFIGSHLVDRLLSDGARVTGIDNFITGRKENLESAINNPDFRLIEAEAVEKLEHEARNGESEVRYDGIYHLASPASPPRYQQHPVATYLVNSLGTHWACELAKVNGARLVFSSTSEAYGDPLEHPQKEAYFGNVNAIGPRAMYDESKRFGEMVCSVFANSFGVDTRVVRIFNTYGPRMDPKDGRVFPSFFDQAKKNEPIKVEGDGQQTRSFCYIDDLVEYLVRAMSTDNLKGELLNIGNPDEHSVLEMAQIIKKMTESSSEIEHVAARPEDIARRQPDISKAKQMLGFEPQISLDEGLERMWEWVKHV